MQKFQFNILKRAGENHYGKALFYNKKEIYTPICWFGLSVIESKSFQLKVFKESKIEAFLSNAYDLYYSDKKKVREALIKDLLNLNLTHKMDSGGFQLMKSEFNGKSSVINLTPKMVLDKQLEIQSDCGVQLDFPFGPNLTKPQKKKRLNKTLENLEQLLKLIDKYGIDFSFLPVIHTVSEDLNLLEYGLSKIEDLLGESPKVLGVGSLVPLVKTIKGSKSHGIESFLYTLICLRKMLPNTFIHAFGIGGTMSYLAILAGIDSYDSNGWIQKAACGVIQLPGISDRFLRKEIHNRPYLIKDRIQKSCRAPINEIDMFMKCKCSACLPYYKKNWKEPDWSVKQKAFIGRDEHPKILRAIHNVSLYQNEIFEIRKAIQKNNLNTFIRNRLKYSKYYRYIDFIERLRSEDIENLNDFNQLINRN